MKYLKTLTLIVLSGYSLCLFGQIPKYSVPEQVLTLKRLLTYLEPEEDPGISKCYDCDSVIIEIRKVLVSYLKSNASLTYSIDTLQNLFVRKSEDGKIKLYTFEHLTGGSNVSTDYSIMQWKNKAGKVFAYDLKGAGFDIHNFSSIHSLVTKDSFDLYLVETACGKYPGPCDGFCTVMIKGDFLILDYPAFEGAPCIASVDYHLQYDRKTKTITAIHDFYYPYDSKNPNDKLFVKSYWDRLLSFKYGIARKDTASIGNERAVKEIKLKFNGRRFIKQ